MPSRKPSDVAHAALTDHRIRVVESEAAVANAAPHELRAWYEPSADMRQRDLGLADLEAAARAGFQALGEAGADLLESLPEAQRSGDAPVLAALGDVELARGQAGKAALLFRRAAELKPTAGELAMYFGISLKQAGDLEGAVRELGRAVQLNPALEQAALALADVYAKRGQSGEASRVLSDSLKWNRQSILVRLTQGTLTMGKK
jgi:Flp pilus assembly protein TadD